MKLAVPTVFALSPALLGAPLFEEQFLFDPAVESHGHVHASCLVETPKGGLVAVWYENGPPLPAPYYKDRADKSGDVRLGGARRAPTKATWDKPFVMHDTFGVSDNNPCMVVDGAERLWLIYATLTGVPDWTWGSGMLRFQISTDYEAAGPPRWDTSNLLIPHPQGIEGVLKNTFDAWAKRSPNAGERLDRYRERLTERLSQPLSQRLGWMPRAHPLVRSDGAMVIPLSNENFNIAVMAITTDAGRTWSYSAPVPEAGVTQPTLVEHADRSLTAYFRNSGPEHRIKRSTSRDGGQTWSGLEVTPLLHPGGGIEVLRLANGNLLMIYNDKEQKPRDRLAVSISADGGATWQWTRHLEDTPGGRFDYPSIIQAKDGTLHATYSYQLKTIKHVRFNEEWVKDGDS